ncbi:hypothetical protein AKJ16_DCAP00477, partial [Drosera capensis]
STQSPVHFGAQTGRQISVAESRCRRTSTCSIRDFNRRSSHDREHKGFRVLHSKEPEEMTGVRAEMETVIPAYKGGRHLATEKIESCSILLLKFEMFPAEPDRFENFLDYCSMTTKSSKDLDLCGVQNLYFSLNSFLCLLCSSSVVGFPIYCEIHAKIVTGCAEQHLFVIGYDVCSQVSSLACDEILAKSVYLTDEARNTGRAMER